MPIAAGVRTESRVSRARGVQRMAARSPVLAPAKRLASAVLNLSDPIVVRRWRRRTADHKALIPPRKLRARVGDPAVDVWIPTGDRVAGELDAVLSDDGTPVTSFERICDFGCGSGRVLTRLNVSPAAELSGLDVDDEAIRWLRTVRPDIDARVNPVRGPAPFGDGEFDLICSISIFTHLNRSSQDLWLAEIRRMLMPGGTALLTVLSEEHRAIWASGARPGINERQRRQLDSASPLTESGFLLAAESRNVWNRWRMRGLEAEYGLAFWDHDALRAAWSRYFDVVEIVPGSINWRQDAVLLKAP